MKRNIVATFLILLVFSCTLSSTSGSETASFEFIVEEFGVQLQKDIKDDGIEGSISAAIVRNDKVMWSKAFGYADKEMQTPADTNTIYRTGSISKSITAFLMMQLVEEGVIKLTDPIEMYLPEIKKLKGYSDSTKITVLQLSTHTSGLIREPELEDAASGPIENWENKIIQSIPHTSFEGRPGEKFSYSNIGYGILGLTLSRAANKPFMELVMEKIFTPLKMNDSYFKVPTDKISKLAKGIGGEPGELDIETPNKEHLGRGYKVPNGGIYSTPNDLAKFAIACMGYQKLLKPENLEFMQTAKDSRNYGVGFFINQNKQMTVVEHGGAVSGYTAQFVFEKTSKYGVILMKNYNLATTDLSARSYHVLKKLTELETAKKD